MKTFQQTQSEFVEYIRDPDVKKLSSDIEDRRLKIYRELFFNNILGFLSSGFPVLESLYGEQNWQALARKFFIHHHCRSPYFVEISKEFVEYLSNEHEMCEDDPAFLQELAHYEWLELDISVRKSEQHAQPWRGETSVDKVTFSNVATLAGYQYPVHQISPEYTPESSSEPIYIVVYRKADFEVGFTVINAVTAHLLSLFETTDVLSLEKISQQMVEALPQIPKEQVLAGTKQTVEELLNQQVLLIPAD